jgi:hypothetical protein
VPQHPTAAAIALTVRPLQIAASIGRSRCSATPISLIRDVMDPPKSGVKLSAENCVKHHGTTLKHRGGNSRSRAKGNTVTT